MNGIGLSPAKAGGGACLLANPGAAVETFGRSGASSTLGRIVPASAQAAAHTPGSMPGSMAGHMAPTPVDLHSAFTAWQVNPFTLGVLVLLALGAWWYLNSIRVLAARGRKWPWQRTAAWVFGLVAIDIALQSPLATFTMSVFTAHVIQHELLMAVAPPLLALGAPSTLLLQTSSRRTKVRLLRVLRSQPFSVVTHPLTVWFLYYGLMFVFFLTGLIGFAMEHMALMDAINIVFLMGGTLFWWPIINRDPILHWKMGYGAKLMNLLLGVPFLSFLGIAIMSDSRPVAPMYTLSSTHSGGALLWILSEMLTVPAAVVVALDWLKAEEKGASREDAREVPVELSLGSSLSSAEPHSKKATADLPQAAVPRSMSAWEAHWLARSGHLPASVSAQRVPVPPTVPPGAIRVTTFPQPTGDLGGAN